MEKKKRFAGTIDDLLRQVLRDDLPPEQEEGLKRRLAQIKNALEQPELLPKKKRRPFRSLLQGLHGLAGAFPVVRKGILALPSLALIILGFFMHLSGQRHVLADPVSLLNALVSVSEGIRRCSSMEGLIRIPLEDGEPLVCSIYWLPPDLTRLDIREPGETARTIWISGHDIVVTDRDKTLSRVGRLDLIGDSRLKMVLDFLSPDVLSARIYSRWRLERCEQTGPEEAVFALRSNMDSTLLKMSVSLNSDLPVHLEKLQPAPLSPGENTHVLMRIDFTWNQPIAPRFMRPEARAEDCRP
jgi:hypothetical protein